MNDNKGEYAGTCNNSNCQRPNSATWFNHSTRKYYCAYCAERINNDAFNNLESMRMFGHESCIESKILQP